MPRAKTHLTPAEYTVLGLLRRRPAHGYELQRSLSGGSGLARVIQVEPAMVYAILKSLSGLELIDGEWDRSVYPPRAVYAATSEGDAEFQRWLRRPVEQLRQVRSDFLIKLFFALQEEPRLPALLVADQIAVCEAYLEAAEAELEATSMYSFDAIVLKGEVLAARQTLDWLTQARPVAKAIAQEG